MHKKTIDPITGKMFTKHNLKDDLRERVKREKANLDSKIEDVEGKSELEENAKTEQFDAIR